MSTREEIAAWLREAAVRYEDLRDILDDRNEISTSMHYAYEAEQLRQRAVQVSAMRCETCEYWRTAIGFIGSCAIEGMPDRCDNDFGCFHHEQKTAG